MGLLISFALLLTSLFFLVCKISALSSHAELYTLHNLMRAQETTYPHFVMFYAAWCDPCKKVQDIWDKYARQNHQARKMKIAKVDCSESTPLCAKERIKAYPTFLLFSGDKKHTFRGKRNLIDFEKFARTKVPTLKDGMIPKDEEPEKVREKKKTSKRKGAKELSAKTFEKEIKNGLTFVDFFAPWCTHCIQLAPIWEKLADYYSEHESITIAKVDCTTEADLCTQMKIEAYPTLILFNNGVQKTSYKLTRSFEALVDFVKIVLLDYEEEQLLSKQTETDTKSEALNDNESVRKTFQFLPNLDVLHFEENVKERKICAFFNKEWSHVGEEYIEFSVVHDFLIAEQSSTKTFVVDCTTEKEFCDKFQVVNFPTVACFTSESGGKVHIHRYGGRMLMADLLKFIKLEESIKDEL